MRKRNHTPGEVLHLSLSADVTLNYNDSHDRILSITVSKSKMGELFRNQTVTKENIMTFRRIGIVFGGNANVFLAISETQPSRETIASILLEVDQDKTISQTGENALFQLPCFKFYVYPNQAHIPKIEFEMLYNLNKKYTAFLDAVQKKPKKKQKNFIQKKTSVD